MHFLFFIVVVVFLFDGEINKGIAAVADGAFSNVFMSKFHESFVIIIFIKILISSATNPIDFKHKFTPCIHEKCPQCIIVILHITISYQHRHD